MERARGRTGWARVPEPMPSSAWTFPDAQDMPDDDLVAFGADLEPSTLIAAYRAGVFPMPLDFQSSIPLDFQSSSPHDDPPMAWWSPVERGVLEPTALRVSRSLRQSTRRWSITIDQSFAEVVGLCASLPRRGGWISADIASAYVRLHELGWAHSVEARDANGRLVGGLYGVKIGRLFAGESMFHLERDASKVALVRLASLLADGGEPSLIDVQWPTPHLESLGVVGVPRSEYLSRLPSLVDS